MKASTSTASLAITMIMAVAHHPLTTWAHQDDSIVSVKTAYASTSTSAGVLRGVIADQEERHLGKGNGGGPNKVDPPPPPAPTAPVTPAPTQIPTAAPGPATPAPTPTVFPPVSYDSCGTRAPVASPNSSANSCFNSPTVCKPKRWRMQWEKCMLRWMEL
jgi:hypothetical protein